MSSTATFDTRQKVLIAAIGNSPAVLTETVWALARQKTLWIPDRVVIITTLTGKAVSEKLLLQQKGWDRLCQALAKEKLPVQGKLAFGASDSIRVIGNGRQDFDDIRTPEEGDAAADFILGVLRQYTEQPYTEIVASIAGGRKTLSALLMACMTLLGRTQDRICHVLADDVFIMQNPEFLFPQNIREQKAADIRLADIPFVRVRGWYEKEYTGVPPSYMTLVRRMQGLAPEPVNYPEVCLDTRVGTVRVGEKPVSLSPGEFIVVLTLIQRLKSGQLFRAWPDVEESARRILSRLPESVGWCAQLRANRQMDSEDFRKWASSARVKFRRAFVQTGLAERLIPSMRGSGAESYPAGRIKIADVSRRQKDGSEKQV